VEIGVTVLAGSDAGSYGVPHGQGLLRELALMERAGMGSLDVLNAATGLSAAHLGLGDDAVGLRPGHRARFILTEGHPLETVTALGRDDRVVFDGRLVPSPETAQGRAPHRPGRGQPCP
jgi:imidazolonepropionase-like amidohydrolase